MKPRYYNVTGVPPAFSHLYSYEKQIYFPMESLGLTKSDVITMVLEFNGDALVGGKKDSGSGIFVSSKTMRRGLIKKLINSPDDFSLEVFDKVIEIVKKKLEESNG